MATKRNEFGFEEFEGGHGKKANQKLKPYLVLQYLLRQSDENHVVSAENIVGYLEESCGIYAERRSIYRDIEEINKAMLIVEEEIDVHEAEERIVEDESEKLVVYDKSKKGFYVRQRHYQPQDIRLLAECVYSAKFLSAGQAERLANVVCEFVSEAQAKTIRHDAFLTDRVKTDNKGVLNSITQGNDLYLSNLCMPQNDLPRLQVHISILNVSDSSGAATAVQEKVYNHPCAILAKTTVPPWLLQKPSQLFICVGLLHRFLFFHVREHHGCQPLPIAPIQKSAELTHIGSNGVMRQS